MREKLQVDDMTTRRRFLETDPVAGAGAALHALGPGRAGPDSPTSGRVPLAGGGPTATSWPAQVIGARVSNRRTDQQHRPFVGGCGRALVRKKGSSALFVEISPNR